VVLDQSLGKDRDNVPNQANIALFHTLFSSLTTRRSKHSNIRILFYPINILLHLAAAVYIISEPS